MGGFFVHSRSLAKRVNLTPVRVNNALLTGGHSLGLPFLVPQPVVLWTVMAGVAWPHELDYIGYLKCGKQVFCAHRAPHEKGDGKKSW